VIWIWLENTGYGGAIGNRTAPYLNRLANGCGLATDYRAVAHPSLPNYLAATSGGTWGVSDDEPPAAHTLAQPSIFDRLAAAGRSWRSYEESMPSNCALDGSGLYAVKHNPAAYYARSRAACARWDVPLGTTRGGAFVSDLRAGRLPAFAFVTPNLCDDAHDCPLAAADRWLAAWVPRIVASPGYRSGSTVVFVTFDEAEGSSNHVATVVVSPSTRPGTRSAAPFTHYSLLKTTEQLLGLRPQLGAAAAASTPSMRRAFGL
jgi:phospholipase C